MLEHDIFFIDMKYPMIIGESDCIMVLGIGEFKIIHIIKKVQRKDFNDLNSYTKIYKTGMP